MHYGSFGRISKTWRVNFPTKLPLTSRNAGSADNFSAKGDPGMAIVNLAPDSLNA